MLNPYKKLHLTLKKPAEFQKTPKPPIVAAFQYCSPGDHHIRKSGKATITNCPFHADKKPSFAMYEETNSAFCFSCGWTGDSYKLIMELLHVDFKEAIEVAKSL